MSIMIRKILYLNIFFAFILLTIHFFQLVPPTFAQVFQEDDNRRYINGETIPIHAGDKRKLVIWGINPTSKYQLELGNIPHDSFMQYNIYYNDQQNCNSVIFVDYPKEENKKADAYDIQPCNFEQTGNFIVMSGVLDLAQFDLEIGKSYGLRIKERNGDKLDTKYTIYYKIVDKPTIILNDTSIVAGTKLEVTLKGLTPNTTYTLKLYIGGGSTPVDGFKATFTTNDNTSCVQNAQSGGGFSIKSCNVDKKKQSAEAKIEIDTTNYNCSTSGERSQCTLKLFSRDNPAYLTVALFDVNPNPNQPVTIEVSPNPGYEGKDVKISASGCQRGTKVHFEWYKGEKTKGDGTGRNGNPEDPTVGDNGIASFTKNNFSSDKMPPENEQYRVVATCDDGRSGETKFEIINTEDSDNIIVKFPDFIHSNTPFAITFSVIPKDKCIYYRISNKDGNNYLPEKEKSTVDCTNDPDSNIYYSNEAATYAIYKASQNWWPAGSSRIERTYNISTQEEAEGLPEGDYELEAGILELSGIGYGSSLLLTPLPRKTFTFHVCPAEKLTETCLNNQQKPIEPPSIPCEIGIGADETEINLTNENNEINQLVKELTAIKKLSENELKAKYNCTDNCGEIISEKQTHLNNLINTFKDKSKKIVRCTAVRTPFGNISTDANKFIKDLLRVLLSISGGIILLLIIRSGYQLITSQGNPEKITEAKDRITSAIIGLLFLIFSLVILEVIGVDILNIPGFSG